MAEAEALGFIRQEKGTPAPINHYLGAKTAGF